MPRFFAKLFLCFFALPLAVAAQQTTWIEQTKSNGSGCAAADSRCYAAFNAMQDNQAFGFNPDGTQSRALSYSFNPTPTNISGPLSGNTQALSIRSLIPYETSANNFRNTSTKVFAHFMPWFYANPYDKAITGYVSNTDVMVQSQLADIKARWVGCKLERRTAALQDKL